MKGGISLVPYDEQLKLEQTYIWWDLREYFFKLLYTNKPNKDHTAFHHQFIFLTQFKFWHHSHTSLICLWSECGREGPQSVRLRYLWFAGGVGLQAYFYLLSYFYWYPNRVTFKGLDAKLLSGITSSIRG